MLLTHLLLACEDAGTTEDATATPTDDAHSAVVSTDLEPADLPLAGGLRIAKVSAYQGVESILVEDGGRPSRAQVGLVAERETLVRVFLDPDPDFEAREVAVIFTVGSGRDARVYQKTPRVRNRSTDSDLDSTVNFELDAGVLALGSAMSVELHETSGSAPGEGRKQDATWKDDDLDLDRTGDLTIALIPVRYDFDGSGRLPDTGAAQVERITELTRAMYPASSLNVRVDPAVAWDRRISPLSSLDWSRLLQELAQVRARASEDPNTYYYGMFEPEPTEGEFCRQGCILGLSLLAQGPNDPYFRTSIGLGYATTTTADTLVHEVGHAHGREHAPCGLGGQSSDRGYPYGGASIGSWGWDLRDGRLIDPDRTVDMMSYCAPIWVSDYTFDALYRRIRDVQDSPRAATVTRRMYAVDDDTGSLELLGDATLAATSVGIRTTVALTGPRGQTRTMAASLYRFGDWEGGFVALDEDLPPGYRATLAPL
jgi:hypothetical protein